MLHNIENYSERDLVTARFSSFVSYADKLEVQYEILRRHHDEQVQIAEILPLQTAIA